MSNVDDVDYVDISQVAEVATRSQSSAEPVFAHTPVADAYKDEQYCMAHIPHDPQPNTGEAECVEHHLYCPPV